MDLEFDNPSSICPESEESFRYSMRGVEDVLCDSPTDDQSRATKQEQANLCAVTVLCAST